MSEAVGHFWFGTPSHPAEGWPQIGSGLRRVRVRLGRKWVRVREEPMSGAPGRWARFTLAEWRPIAARPYTFGGEKCAKTKRKRRGA